MLRWDWQVRRAQKNERHIVRDSSTFNSNHIYFTFRHNQMRYYHFRWHSTSVRCGCALLISEAFTELISFIRIQISKHTFIELACGKRITMFSTGNVLCTGYLWLMSHWTASHTINSQFDFRLYHGLYSGAKPIAPLNMEANAYASAIQHKKTYK